MEMQNSFPLLILTWALSYFSILINFLLPNHEIIFQDLASLGSFFGGAAALMMACFAIYKYWKGKK
jgi:type II secretory pathway component PulF